MGSERGHWADGMVLALSGHVVPMFLLFQPNVLPRFGTANPLGVYVPLRPFMMVPGIAQLVWLIPIALWAWGTGRRDHSSARWSPAASSSFSTRPAGP